MFGVDYVTWHYTFPQMSEVVNKCAEQITGRGGNFLPVAVMGFR